MNKKDDMGNMMRMLDKLICVLVAFPPLYMLFRFLRWYARADAEVIEEQPNEPAGG